MSAQAAILPHVQTDLDQRVRYFAHDGSVDYRGDRTAVYVGGHLIGTFCDDEPVERDLLVVIVCAEPGVRRGRVADAFGIHRQTVRRILLKHEQGGLKGLGGGHRRGRPLRQTPELEQELFALFDEGLSVRQARDRLGCRASVGVVARVRKKWARERAVQSSTSKSKGPEQIEIPVATQAADHAVEELEEVNTTEHEHDDEHDGLEQQPRRHDGHQGSCDELGLEQASRLGGKRVQHLGCWIMLAMLHALGLYQLAEGLRDKTERERRRQGKKYLGAVTLRAALDAVAVALSLGKRCVEGVRWLDTPSGPALLRRSRAISASWCRRVLGWFASNSALELHWQQGVSLMNSGAAGAERAVFYIDNHARSYTGKHTLRKVWRMQDKRARPGVCDFYVHDDEGRPLVRIADPANGPLTDWLLPTGRLLRTALGGETKVLLVFDRGGAYPGCLAELRDEGLELVTYERAPYRTLPEGAFKHKRWIQLGPKRYRIVEQARKNLGKGRGRLRRIYLQTEQHKQLSVLAISEAPADLLAAQLIARWPRQENQLKHQVERWGSNQLDGRIVEPYPPDEVIPNPARGRLDRQLRIARAAEGDALRRLAALDEHHPDRESYEQDLEQARQLQRELEALRPEVPTHAPVEDTELAGKLVRHPGHYKLVIDTLRVALANVESDLATWLAPELHRPKEAKKHLAKLFDAPGTIRPNGNSITVALEPAATQADFDAFESLMSRLNALRLTLPGDPSGRPLRFKCNRK